MKTFYKVFLCIIIAIGVIPSCSDDDGCSGFEVEEFFNVTGMTVSHIRGDSISYAPLDPNVTIAPDDYNGVHIYAEAEFYSNVIRKTNPFIFGQRLMACSVPANGWNGSETESIVDIKVVTVNELNEDFPANSDISEIVNVRTFDETTPLTEFIDREKGKLLEVYLFPITLQPTMLPIPGKQFVLEITFTLNDGESYKATTSAVTFI